MRIFRNNCYITGIILIILGALSLRYPLSALITVGTFIGIGLVMSALNYFTGFYFFRLKRFVLLGVLDLITGVIMLTRPGLTSLIIPFVMALWLLCVGLSRIGASLWLGGAKVRGWWLMLLNGIALVIFAAFMCASPLTSALSIMMVLAVSLIASGVLSILEGYFM